MFIKKEETSSVALKVIPPCQYDGNHCVLAYLGGRLLPLELELELEGLLPDDELLLDDEEGL